MKSDESLVYRPPLYFSAKLHYSLWILWQRSVPMWFSQSSAWIEILHYRTLLHLEFSMFELVRFWERDLRTQRLTLLRLTVHARFVSVSHATRDSLEVGTSCLQAQGSNQYLHVRNTYKEGRSVRCGWCSAPGTTVNSCSEGGWGQWMQLLLHCTHTGKHLEGQDPFFLAIRKNFTPIQIHKYSLDPLAFFI